MFWAIESKTFQSIVLLTGFAANGRLSMAPPGNSGNKKEEFKGWSEDTSDKNWLRPVLLTQNT